MTNPVQPLDPAAPPPAMTPSDSPSNPAGFAQVTPHGRGPAPYDIQADLPDLTGVFDAANAVEGAGVLYPQSPRQAATEQLLSSPAGYGAFSIQQGFSGGGGGDGWPNDMTPPAQPGYVYPGGDYPGTVQPGAGMDDYSG